MLACNTARHTIIKHVVPSLPLLPTSFPLLPSTCMKGRTEERRRGTRRYTVKRVLVTNYKKVAQHVMKGVENTKDNSLRQYFIGRLMKKSQTTNHKPPKSSNPLSEWQFGDAQSTVQSVDMDYKILSHLIFIKHQEGWTIKECAYVIELVTKDWDLPKIVQFFGHFLNYYVIVPSTSLYKSHLTSKNHPRPVPPISPKFTPTTKQLPPLSYPFSPSSHKWTTTEFGELIAISMSQKEYSYMVPLLVRMVLGEPSYHLPALDYVSSQDGAAYLSGIAKLYGVVLAYFPNWDFPFLGSVMRDLANVVPKFVHKHYTWWTYDLYINFAVDVVLHAAQVAQKIDKAVTYNPRFINGAVIHVMEGWNDRDKEELMTRFYAVADDNDNFISFYLKKIKMFFGSVK